MSNDKWCYKIAALRSYINRAITHSSTEEFLNEEIEKIIRIAEKHGYVKGTVKRLFSRILKARENVTQIGQERLNQNRPYNSETINKEYEVITEALRHSKTVKKLIKKSQKKPAYKRGNTVQSRLRNIKDAYDRVEQTGVYEIPLVNNDKQQKEIYVGVTTRNLRERLKEHDADIKNGKLITALARRAYEYDVKIEWEEAKVVRKVSNDKELKIAEEIKIFQGSERGRIINERQSLELLQAWKFALRKNRT